MKNKLSALVIGLMAAATAIAAGKDAGPVRFSDTVYDFGTVSQDAPAQTHRFVMHNTGTVPVAILSATSSCGCTRPDFDKRPIQPGDSTVITVSFFPQGQGGSILRDIKLKLRSADSKKNFRRTLKIQGNVKP